MHTLLKLDFNSFPEAFEPELWTPKFVVELPPWSKVFFGNLVDLVAGPFRRRPPLELTSKPAPFWPDVFVQRRLPVAPFRQSVLYHAFIVVALWGFSQTWLARPVVRTRNPFENTKLVYYPISEYLPPIGDDPPPAKVEQKGMPAYARQRIVSVPRNPDNSRQTIVAPSPLKLHSDVPLPNIVAWNQVAPPLPAAVAAGVPARLPKPTLPEAVAPAPEISAARLRAPALEPPAPVAPPPLVNQMASKAPTFVPATPVAPPPDVTAALRPPTLPTPAVVEPPPATSGMSRAGQLNIARTEPAVAAPRLPTPEQRAIWIKSGAGQAGAAGRTATSSAADANIAAPSLPSGGAGGSQTVGQIVALGLHPVTPVGPVVVPEGNRRGVFAAGPDGKLGGPGVPDIHGGGVADGPGGHAHGGNESPLAGITVAAGPVNPGPIAAAGPPVNAAPAKVMGPTGTSSPNAFRAALGPTRAAEVARLTRPSNAPDAPRVQDPVFGMKRYYSMILNMPNLTSRGGSWIIRFAELHETRDKAELTAPVAMLKVDPAYPAALLREGREGEVVLYAVIHADGTVGEVRVLHGIEGRLDASAREALMKWHFRPATKNGSAVDLEAVIQIPFKSAGF